MTSRRTGERVMKPGWITLLVLVAPFFTVATSAMEIVRQETRVDEAASAFGVSGAGVVIAVLDRGIDWSHPDFINEDGTTRIKWMLDMSGFNLCNSGNPLPVEYTEAQINAALAGGPSLAMRDAIGHGTATAGTAAGNGKGLPDQRYRGIAPDADLVIVKLGLMDKNSC